MDNDDHKVMMMTLLGTAAAILASLCYCLLFTKRMTMRNSSYEGNKGDGIQASSADASVTDLSDGETYEVFLSFRGEDTRKGFTDHLYNSLSNVAVRVFRDDDALRVGEKISPELEKAIKASKMSILIISSNYASSEWCLWELVHILECKKTSGQVVLPIFYRVDTSSVRKQTGTFEEAFRLYEKKYGSNSEVVKGWRNALAEVASLKGWESSKIADGHEGQLVEIVVTKVLNELRKATLTVTDELVGIEDHVEEILNMIESKGSDDARILVIHGMGGVGKTTLAKVVYNRLSTSFKHCSFLSDLRDKLSERNYRPEDLQKQLISDILGQQWPNNIAHVDEGIRIIKGRLEEKKVLILFDDVVRTNQLNALARDRNWFRSGSILIITTRNKDVLDTWDGRLTYELNGLDPSLSFLLFCRYAFRRDECPSVEFDAIAKGIVATTGGLPLAIEVIGSMLLGKSKDYWTGVLKQLQDFPNLEVQKTLRISYDALEENHKQIFLDIACLPIQNKIDFAMYMWDDCKFYPEVAIEDLICRSLIKMGQNKQLIIHDQLRDLGRGLVRKEDPFEAGNRSRIWSFEEASKVMERKQGTAKIQALNLPSLFYTSEQFKGLKNLRFLQGNFASLHGDFDKLLLDLRWLHWNGCHSLSLPTNFRPMDLRVLDLSYSMFSCQWEGWAHRQMLKKLKVLILEYCHDLTVTPDFFAFECLAILSVKGCKQLERIHPSICKLNNTLITLDVRNCERLKKLPVEMDKMEELRQLLVDGTSIESIPISGFMTKLEILSASGCAQLQNLPDSIGSLVNLVTLSLDSCHGLTILPETVGNLRSLTELNLKESKVMELPSSIGDLHNLKLLDISKTSIKRLPTTFGKLRNLKHFTANYLDMLTKIPDEIGQLSGLQFLSFRECSLLSQLPKSIHDITSLQMLDLSGCEGLKSMPNLPCSLSSLNFSGKSMETFQSVTSLSNSKDLTYHDKLKRQNRALNFTNLNNLESLSIDGIGYPICGFEYIELILELPSSLKKLCLSNCPALRALPNLSNFKLLSSLEIVRCGNLSRLSWMNDSVTCCELKHCNALKSSLHLPSVRNLKLLSVWECTNLIEMQGLDSVECLEKLEVGLCPSLERLGDLSRLKLLRELILVNCEKLSDFDGIDEQTSLKTVKVVGCNPKIRSLDLTKLKNLKILEINQFEVLTEIMMLKKLEYLEGLKISCCNSIEKLPDISPFTSLKEVHIDGCVKLRKIKGLQELKNLRRLDLSNCKSLETLLDFSLLTNLKCLILDGCEKLTKINGLPMSLRVLDMSRCKSMGNLPDFSRCIDLTGLFARGCNKLTNIMGLHRLDGLKILDISNCKSIENFPNWSKFLDLIHLDLNGCEKLTEIGRLPQFLETLNISGCKSLTNLPDFSEYNSLKGMLAAGCSELRNLRRLLRLSRLEILDLSDCKSLKDVPEFSLLKKLKHLNLSGCEKLTLIRSLPVSLETLDVSRCKLLAKLPGFSGRYSLEGLLAEDCSKLEEIRGLEDLQKLRVLGIHGCESLKGKLDVLRDRIHRDTLHKTGKMTPIIRVEREDDDDGLPEYHVSIIWSTFQFDGSDPQTILSCGPIPLKHPRIRPSYLSMYIC